MTSRFATGSDGTGRFLRTFLPIVAPAFLLLVLSMVVIFVLLVPLFERTYVQQKRNLCRRIVESAVSGLQSREQDVQAGLLTRAEAQARAIARLRDLRFGEAGKDYLWIIGPDGRFLMHPYRPDLEGRDPRRVEGPDGEPLQRLVDDMNEAVGAGGDGFLSYRWHWKDDLARLVDKISYVDRFEPWNWIVGTGVYVDDMARDLASLRRRLIIAGAVLGLIASGLALVLSVRVMRSQEREAEAHRKLAASEEYLRITLRSIGEAVIATDTDGRIREMNAVAEDLTGVPLAEARGRPLADVVRIVDATTGQPISSPVDEVLATGEVVQRPGDTLLLGRDDDYRRIADSGAPIRNRSGEVVGVVLVFRDVTHEHALQERLRQAQKMEVIGRLAGGVAHDFNNMLAAIMGSADLIDMDLPADSPLRAHLAAILKASRNASGLTQKLLTFSRKAKLASAPVDLHETVEEAIVLLRRSLDRRIRIETRLEASDALVVGDAAQLQNLFLNLALNARDAMPDGGTLTFATATVAVDGDGDAPAAADLAPGRYVQVTVEDTGVGMPAEVRDKVLEPFYTTKPVGKGTGLGLATAYGTVKEHHGAIRIDSEPGRGTGVHVLLPVAETVAERSERDEPEIARGQGLILVVDDEDLVRSMAAAQLRSLGYDVLQARDGVEALEIFAREGQAVDAVLLDLVMPRLGGRETFARLRGLRADVPVIFSSGYDPDDALDDLRTYGGVGFVAKPYRRSDLADALAGVTT